MGEDGEAASTWRAGWTELALALPRHHDAAEHGDIAAFEAAVTAREPLDLAGLAALGPDDVLGLALDVLMVEAFARRRADMLAPSTLERVAVAARAVAARADLQPILSYPLYIRHNPMAAGATRLFTPYPAEERFVRMHRFIEDRFDEVIDTLEAVVDAPDALGAYVSAHPEISAAFGRINRVMAGFRDPERMPNAVFSEGFRPYYQSVLDPATGDVVLDGPSGLQSPTFRVVTMLAGYRDETLDAWTERIGRYHAPSTRDWLANARVARDAGRALGAVVDRALGVADDLPHIHPSYSRHHPALIAIARRGGWLTADALDVLAAHAIDAHAWPMAAASSRLPVAQPWPDLEGASRLLAPFAELEAMLFGFHVEHVAVAAAQIGTVRGTGGTSGVEFLQTALFRRAFPALWERGIGARVAAGP